jgi:hypothetical protein
VIDQPGVATVILLESIRDIWVAGASPWRI